MKKIIEVEGQLNLIKNMPLSIKTMNPAIVKAENKAWGKHQEQRRQEWLAGRYPKDKSKFKRMRKNRLYAIYYNVIKGV